MSRSDGRGPDDLRPVTITSGTQTYAEGSVTVETGLTRVLCSVSLEESVPPFLKGRGRGWITAEYGMLPRATTTRSPREARSGGPRGRTHEIQRLIGRSLRMAVDMQQLGERTLTVDCDVIQADGGTRTAAITGAYVALHLAISTLIERRVISSSPLRHAVAATSVGLVDGEVLLDLTYEEDFAATADFNIVMTDAGEYVEVQGTGEEMSFSREALDRVLSTAAGGIERLLESQRKAIARDATTSV